MAFILMPVALFFTAIFAVGTARASFSFAPRLGRGFLGAILLGALSSTPELYLSVSAASEGMADLCTSGLLGANLCNLTILMVIDIFVGRQRYDESNLLSAVISLVMYTFVLAGMLFPDDFGTLGPLGMVSLGLLAVYGIGLFMLSRHDQAARQAREIALSEEPAAPSNGPFRRVALYGMAMALAATSAAYAARVVIGSEAAGVAGGLMLSLVTSLPELVLVMLAVRSRASELGVGVIFGANIANLGLLAVADLAFPAEQLLAELLIPKAHILFSIEGIFLTNLTLIGLLYGKVRRIFKEKPILV